MKIERFGDIEAWKLARELTQQVYRTTRGQAFSRDFELRGQVRAAAGSAMHNIAEGFDAGSNAEFLRFLRYAHRSCAEVQSELYVALDEAYISPAEFEALYIQAGRTRSAIQGFCKYLSSYEASRKRRPKTA